jgi:hypothetical protein
MTEQDPEKQASEAAPDEEMGVGLTTGEPNTFEPEEDPDAAAEPGGTTPG